MCIMPVHLLFCWVRMFDPGFKTEFSINMPETYVMSYINVFFFFFYISTWSSAPDLGRVGLLQPQG